MTGRPRVTRSSTAFSARFPDRYLNVGVAEQNMTGIAAGLAHFGKVPFTYSIANFPTFRCLEQIRNDICYHGANVKVVAVGGGFVYGSHGYTHHGIEDLGVMRALPGMTVVAPGDPIEARLATRAVAASRGPCYLRLGKANEPVVMPGRARVPGRPRDRGRGRPRPDLDHHGRDAQAGRVARPSGWPRRGRGRRAQHAHPEAARRPGRLASRRDDGCDSHARGA